jgi:hypothetical protein
MQPRLDRWILFLAVLVLIREGFDSGIPGEQLADAAGLSVPRVYQIRDGRR